MYCPDFAIFGFKAEARPVAKGEKDGVPATGATEEIKEEQDAR
jgi:hypothetical protein